MNARGPRKETHRVFFLLAVAWLTACGRKGPVRPPELVVPVPITEVTVSNGPDAVVLTWPRPATYADGTRLTDLAGFVVERAVDGGSFVPLTTLDVSDRERFRQIKRFRFADRDVAPGIQYRYRVVSFTLDHYVSPPSHTVEIVRDAAGSADAREGREKQQ